VITLQLSQKENHMKKSRGQISLKENISLKVFEISKESKSINEFSNKLEQNGLEPYYRNNKLSGIWLGYRKYRLTTLVVDKSKIRELSIEQQRLNQLRKKSKSRNREL
jgi:hypothetical protein